MDIPRLLADAAPDDVERLIDQRIVSLKFSDKDRQKGLINVFMIFDLQVGQIRFEPHAWQDGDEKRYCYLGNNQAAANQIYAVREPKSFVHFWLGRMKGIMQNILDFLQEGELYELFLSCREQDFFGDNGLQYDKIINWNSNIQLVKESKKFMEQDKAVTADKLLAALCGIEGTEKICLIIPVIQTGVGQIVISQHADYQTKIEQSLQGNDAAGSVKKKKAQQVCHICGKSSDSIDTKGFSSKLSKKSVGKVFVTTQINYSAGFDKGSHQNNFAICKDCYAKWFAGEQRVMNEYRLRIAKEPAVLLFEGIHQKADREDIEKLKSGIDAAFDTYKICQWAADLSEQEIGLYEFNILFYQTDGKSCSISKTIEDISDIRFDAVMKAFSKVQRQYELRIFQPGSLYGLIPVRTNNKDEQLNVSRIFELYSCIFKGYPISLSKLFEWYAEAVNCGYRYIKARDLRNEKNLMGLKHYVEEHQKDSNTAKHLEWYIRDFCRYYMAFMEVLRKLDLLEGDVFFMDETARIQLPLNHTLEEKEAYLNEHSFGTTARGLYYLGAAMYTVGEMQAVQGHKNKPILEKIDYSGLRREDILSFSAELRKAIQQYRKAMESRKKGYLTYRTEQYLSMSDRYLGDFPNQTDCENECENLFYLMSGYSSCIYIGAKKNETNNGEDIENAEEQS